MGVPTNFDLSTFSDYPLDSEWSSHYCYLTLWTVSKRAQPHMRNKNDEANPILPESSRARTKTRPHTSTSWSSVPWNSKSPAGNPAWGNRPSPSEGSRSVNESTERTWPWLTDGLSQRRIPVESTIHFILHARTHIHTRTLTHACTHKPIFRKSAKKNDKLIS